MAKLSSPPSLQHLVRTWRDSPERTRKVLVNNARSRPIFSYAPLRVAIREMLVLGVPYHQVVEYVRRVERLSLSRYLQLSSVTSYPSHTCSTRKNVPGSLNAGGNKTVACGLGTNWKSAPQCSGWFATSMREHKRPLSGAYISC